MRRLSEDLLKAIGGEIRRRREAAGYTLETLAERAELHWSYLSKIERARADLSVSALWSIAVALGCEVADLLPGTPGEITPDVLALARLLAAADPEVRAATLTLLSRIPNLRRRLKSAGK